jgi:hypothetical protein
MEDPYLSDLKLDGSEILYTADGQSYALNEAGHAREIELLSLNPGVHEGGPVYHTYTYIYDPSSYRYQIRDEQGGVLLETQRTLRYSNAGFVLEYDLADMNPPPRAVYAPDGTLLLGDVLSFIYEAPAPGGGMFVYLDEATCVLLYLDGTTIPVPNAPVVTAFGVA